MIFSDFISLSWKENSKRLRLISDVGFPFTYRILLGNKLNLEAKKIKLSSSLNGIITEKIPLLDSDFETPSINCSKVRVF